MPIEVDERGFPLVLVRVYGAATDRELHGYLRHMESLIERAYNTGQRVVHVYDTRGALLTSAAQRKTMGDWMKTHDVDNRETCGGFAFVFESAIVRGALTAILWLHPLPAPHRIFSGVAEAADWAREQIGQVRPARRPPRAAV